MLESFAPREVFTLTVAPIPSWLDLVLYYTQALYLEAKDRLEAFLNSSQVTILRSSPFFNSNDFQRDALYAYANSLDAQYSYIDQKAEFLPAVLAAWERFARFSDCTADPDDKRCRYAVKRESDLSGQKKK